MARPAIRLDDHMADLAGIPAEALVDMAIDEEPCAEAHAEEEIGETGETLRTSMQMFADRRGLGIVLEEQREADLLRDRRDIRIGPAGETGRTHQAAAFGIEWTRHCEPGTQ